MASGTSTYLANKILDFILGQSAYTPPATVYAALYSVAPTAAGGGTEATGSGYARASITNNLTNWSTAASAAKNNAVAITWAAATGDWSSAAPQVAVGIHDALSAGNLLYFAGLSVPKIIYNGDTYSIPITQLAFTLT
jgi:hypothetical protein